MSESKRIKTALVSVYHKEGLDEIITKLHEEGVEFLSTGGTRQFIESLGYPCKAVEDLTSYPSILGGRVKTLHPKIFGGILCRRGLEQDIQQIEKYEIPEIDLVIVDLYPFEATVASGADEAAIIEKIDIGGISLIRAAAKNFNDVIIVASQAQYKPLLDMLMEHGATSSLEERRWMAKEAFAVSSHYDSASVCDGAPSLSHADHEIHLPPYMGERCAIPQKDGRNHHDCFYHYLVLGVLSRSRCLPYPGRTAGKFLYWSNRSGSGACAQTVGLRLEAEYRFALRCRCQRIGGKYTWRTLYK